MSTDVEASVAAHPGGAPLGGRRWLPSPELVVWLAILAIAAWWLDDLGRSRTFFYDEWNFVADRWRFQVDTFFAAHNGHLSIVPATVFLGLFHVTGLDDYRIFRATGLLVHFSVASAVFVYVRSRVGSLGAFGGGLIVLFLGTAWQNILWPFQIGFMGSTLAFIVALLALDRRSVRGDIVASSAVAVSLGCSGVGVAALAAVMLEVALTRPWRRWWIAIAPAFMYGVWYLAYGDSQSSLDNLDRIPRYVVDSATAASAGVFGWTASSGRILLLILIIAGALVILWRRNASARMASLLAAILTFWCLTALSRGQFGDPGASRYIYVGVVVIVLLAAELVDSRRWITGAVGLVIGLMSIWATSDVMRAGADGLRYEGQLIGAELAVLETYRHHADADYVIDAAHAPGLTAERYLAAVDGLDSSPAVPPEVIDHMPDFARAGADRVLLELARPSVSTSSPDVPPNCHWLSPSPDGVSDVQVDPGSDVFVTAGPADAVIRVGRWAPPASELTKFAPGTSVRASFPRDDLAQPWLVSLSGASAACVASG